MKYIKTYESYWTKQEYIEDVISGLKKHNLSPNDINKIVNQYEDEILSFRDSGKTPQIFVSKMNTDLGFESGEFIGQNLPSGDLKQIKYL